MKFPGGHRLRKIWDTFNASAVDPEATIAAFRAEIDAKQAAQAARNRELRVACADRLRPYVQRLVLVNNFKEARVEENAARISAAVLTRLGVDVPIGVSAVLSSGRGNHQALLETADALVGALGNDIGEHAVPLRPEHESSDLWLLSLARVPEAMAHQTGLPPEELGCIAVVSALDMNRQADVPGVPEPGAALLLAGVSEEARFSWEVVSWPNY